MSRYLLVTRVGQKSLHAKWLGTPGARNFDVVISAYDPSVARSDGPGLYFERRPGWKVKGYNGFLDERAEFWRQYDYICLWDEDLDTDIETLNAMFEICAAQGFKIAQPALTTDSYFTFAALIQQKVWKWRYVNFIEMMCPIFRNDVLEEVKGLYGAGFEVGIDLIWCNLVYSTPRDFAIIDSTPIRHTEPVGQQKAGNGFTDGRTYEDDIYTMLALYDLPWLSCVPYSGVTKGGREISSRSIMFLAAFVALTRVAITRSYWSGLRPVINHLRHVALRPARNIKVAARAPAGPAN